MMKRSLSTSRIVQKFTRSNLILKKSFPFQNPNSKFSSRVGDYDIEVRLYEHDKLEKFTKDVFCRLGIKEEDAALAANVLAMSDIRGIDSHGVARLYTYFDLIRAGRINLKPNIKIIRETATTATVDGDNGLGLIVAPKSNEIAMKKAKEYGSGWVSVCNTNHFGIAGYYPLQALKHDLIGWAMTNTTKLVAPFRGAEAMLGTNPIAIAFPGKNSPPIVIDMATSVVPYGKIEIAQRKNTSIPYGWAINNEGEITTDPNEVANNNGALLPLGSDQDRSAHKGYCLSIMCDILCCVLSGANWGPFAPPFTLQRVFQEDREKARRVGKGIGHFFGAMRIDGFIDPNEFKTQIDEYRKVFYSTKPAKGTSGPILPGDPEHKEEKKRLVEGVPLVMPVVRDLQKIAQTLGMKFLD